MSDKHAQLLHHGSVADDGGQQPSWRLKLSEFRLPDHAGTADPSSFCRRFLCRPPRKQEKIANYYRRQEMLIKSFSEMDSMNESGYVPGGLTKDEMEQLARSERMAIHASNIANMVLFAAKVFASVESGSLAVIASTLDSFLDLLSGFILWFTSNAMRKPNYKLLYPIGKRRMQQVGILVFATAMATLGIQIIIESARELTNGRELAVNHVEEMWMIGIMISVTAVKFVLMVYCRRFKNEIVRAYAQDHFFDVITNSIGLVTAILAIKYKWWIDPVGAMVIAVYTITTWARTVLENASSLVAKAAPPAFLSKVTYLVWNHHEEIQHIDTVRAYALGSHYFVEVDIVLPQNMVLAKAHDIGETLQEKLESLPKVERAFVHIDYDYTHCPEHKIKA